MSVPMSLPMKSEPMPRRSRNRQAGFTLIELSISLVVIIEVLLAVLLLFDFSNKISRVQSNVADLQQALRSSQSDMDALVRMAGRGGLPFIVSGANGGGALAVRKVGTSEKIGDATSPDVVDGTDVLTVRGVFSTPIYQVNAKDTATFIMCDASNAVTTTPTAALSGTLTISSTSPTSIPQDLKSLDDAWNTPVNEALLLVSARNPGVYAVVELDPSAPPCGPAGPVPFGVSATTAKLKFFVRGGSSGLANSYATLYPGITFPAGMTSVGFAGILEEHRFYVRKSATTSPRLSRARFMPNTNVPYGKLNDAANSANLQIDVADGVLDLQVALGIDTLNHVPRVLPPGASAEPPGLTSIDADEVNGYISESTTGVDDDWLGNSPADSAAAPVWTGAQLYFVRVNVVARTDRRDNSYEAPILGRIEDRTYAVSDALNVPKASGGTQRMFRRRILQTIIDVRNL
jgi:type II secretory pathway pseudopilin PulG